MMIIFEQDIGAIYGVIRLEIDLNERYMEKRFSFFSTLLSRIIIPNDPAIHMHQNELSEIIWFILQ